MFLEVNTINNIIVSLNDSDKQQGVFDKIADYHSINFQGDYLIQFCKENVLPPYNTIIITDKISYIHDAVKLGIGTIYFNQGQNSVNNAELGIDFFLEDINDIPQILSGRLTNYLGEYLSESILPYRPRGFRESIHNDFYYYLSFDNTSFNGSYPRVTYLGRYFPQRDNRSLKSAYIARVLTNKKFDSQADFFANLLRQLSIGLEIDLDDDRKYILTYVPPRPSDTRDKFKKIFKCIIGNKYNNLLKCIRDYPSQKTLSATERRENVKGAFVAESELRNKVVLIFDDVLTTGATMIEIIKTIYKQDPQKVIPVVFGRDISARQPGIYKINKYLKCSECGHDMILAIGRNGGAYAKCSNNSKHNNIYYNDYVEQFNQANDFDNLTDRYSIDYLDIGL